MLKELKKEVKIQIKGRQRNEEEEDVVETVAFGELACMNDKYYLRYEEISEDGQSSKTMIKITEKQIEVTRRGGMESKMVFMMGQVSFSEYMTPYGNLEMGLDTKEMKYSLDENGLQIYLKYLLYLNNAIVSENTLYIEGCFC